MTRLKPSKRLLLGLFLVAILGLGAAAARSALIDKDNLRAHLKSRFAAWTGGELLIDGATRVSIFPTTRIEVDDVSISNLPRMAGLDRIVVQSMRAEFGFWSLLWGNPSVSRLTLTKPKFTLGEKDTTAAFRPQSDSPVLVSALQQAPFSRLTIEQGVLALANGESPDAMGDIQANMTVSPAGSVALEGALTWRNQTVTYALQSDPPNQVADKAEIPVRITIGGDLITAVIDGTATLAADVHLAGTLNLNLPNTREFSRWLGVGIPDGKGLGLFNSSGDFNWVAGRIAYDSGTFELDGNRAIGALAIVYDKDRPEIEGTLALQTLSLDTYLASVEAPEEKEADTTAGSVEFELGFPLLQHVDVDLRLSATQLRAQPIDAGQTALTLTVKSGALSADISILDLFGGRGSGRLELETQQALPKLRVSATLNGLAAQQCIEAFSPESPVNGGIDLQLDITGYGADLASWLEKISGNLEIAIPEGALDFDLAKVMDRSRTGDLRGWPAVRGNQTKFEQLKADLAFEGGSVHSRNFAVQTGVSKIIGQGTIDIPSRLINWRFELPDTGDEAANAPENDPLEMTRSLIVQGPWSAPIFRLEQKRVENDAPLGQRAAARPPARAF